MSRDLLSGDYKKSSMFYATLAGAKQSLRKFLRLPDFPIVHSNDKKVYMRKAEGRTFPYAYMIINSIAIKEDAQALKTLRRHYVTTRANLENSTVDAQYALPIKINVELHFVTDDFTKAMDYALHVFSTLGIEALNLTLKPQSAPNYKVRMVMDSKEITLPPADLELESDPSGHDIAINFTIESWYGEVKQVAKINNDGAAIIGIELEEPSNATS